jgi:hypothetical protein
MKTKPNVFDFISGEAPISSKHKCPVCGGNEWYALKIDVFVKLSDDVGAVVDLNEKDLFINNGTENHDICTKCLTVVTG